MSSCAANDLECDGVVYFCDNVWGIVLATIGSFRVWIACMVSVHVEYMFDLVCLANMLLVTLGVDCYLDVSVIVSDFFCIAPLVFVALFFSWPPLEVSVGYRTGVAA